MCNPFTDKDVLEHLRVKNIKVHVKDVYKACSGGAAMNCGSCACELKSIVDVHNNTLTISELTEQMQHATESETETA